MKYLSIILTIFLVSCKKDIFQKDAKQLIGKWELNQAWENPDGSWTDKRDKSREHWEIEFSADKKVVFNDGTQKLYGEYEHSFNQLKMKMYNDSTQLEDVWLWYGLLVNKNSMETYSMEEKKEYHYIWRKK